MRSKLVSVIIPSFNRVHTLDRAISSVKRQNYNNIEVVIIDDASTDATQNFLKDYDFGNLQYKIIKNTVNLWISTSRNIWIEKSLGDYVAFLDSDDEWIETNKIKLQTDFLDKNLDYWFVGTECELDIPHPIKTEMKNIHTDKDFREIALSYFFIHIDTWLLRRETIDAIGKFWKHRCEDYEYLLRIWLKTKFGFLILPSAHYHNNTNGDHSIKIFLTWITRFYIIFRYAKFYPHFWRHFLNRLFRCVEKWLSFK